MSKRTIASIAIGIVAAGLTAVEVAAGPNGWATAAIALAAGAGAGTAARFVWGGIAGTLGCAALAAVLAASPAGEARAHEMPCNQVDAMRTVLAVRYGEQRVAMGTLSRAGAAELWLNEATRSWTLLGVRADGVACAFAAGEFWEKAKPVAAPATEG